MERNVKCFSIAHLKHKLWQLLWCVYGHININIYKYKIIYTYIDIRLEHCSNIDVQNKE